jgi:hypothetical protein
MYDVIGCASVVAISGFVLGGGEKEMISEHIEQEDDDVFLF